MNKATALRLSVSSLVLATGVACSSESNTTRSAAPEPRPATAQAPGSSNAPAVPTSTKFQDPVAAAALRERAIGELTQDATAGPAEIRVNAIEGLSVTPRRVEPIVRAALVDQSPAVRITAAVVVGNTKLQSSASFVEPLTRDPVLAVRASAAYALKRCGYDPDMAPLAELLADQSPRWRAHAAFLLGKLGDRSALPMLEDAVRDTFARASGSEIRLMELQVAQAKVRLGNDEALHSIRAALFPARSEDLEATALAAQIAGEINDRAAARELVMLTRMKDDAGNVMPPEVRMAAAGSLGALRIGQSSPDAVAMEYVKAAEPTHRAQAAFVLGQCGRREYLETLETLLQDQNPQVRVTAAAAITRLTEASGSAGIR
jgi:HEAT repeat protein